MSNTYYEIKAINIDGDDEILFGSYVKSDCQYELQAERESWKDEGYRQIKLTSRDTDEQPDETVYSATELAQADVDADDMLDTDELAADLQEQIDTLQHQKIMTGGHGRRARIQARIDKLQAELDELTAKPRPGDDLRELLHNSPNMENFDTVEELVNYLTNTLIPDLKEAGSYATAEDFEDCLQAIAFLQRNQRPEPVDSEAVLRTVILRGRPEVC